MNRVSWTTLGVVALLAGCGGDTPDGTDAAAFASTYAPAPAEPVLIRNATVMTGTGAVLAGADVLMVDGRIERVGESLRAPRDTTVIDATGRFVTPGIIDVHSHLGVYPSPGVIAHSDGNEATAPNTAEVWAEHSVWPQDPGFSTALAGGVTTRSARRPKTLRRRRVRPSRAAPRSAPEGCD